MSIVGCWTLWRALRDLRAERTWWGKSYAGAGSLSSTGPQGPGWWQQFVADAGLLVGAALLALSFVWLWDHIVMRTWQNRWAVPPADTRSASEHGVTSGLVMVHAFVAVYWVALTIILWWYARRLPGPHMAGP